MQIPFNAELFFDVFRTYNNTVWPIQVLLNGLGIIAVILIALPRRWSGAAVSAILAALWVWMGAAYHIAFFAQINTVAYGFGLLSIVGGLLFVWHGVIHRRLEFTFNKSPRACVGSAFLIFSLLGYPAWATVAGHPYPELPTFGLPCPTTIFTIGVLHLAAGTGLRKVLIIPIIWTMIGGQAAFLFDVKPDLGLFVAGVAAILLFVWTPRSNRSVGDDSNTDG